MDARKDWLLTPQKCSTRLYNRLTFALALLRFGSDADIFLLGTDTIPIGCELHRLYFRRAAEVVEALPLLGLSDERSQGCTYRERIDRQIESGQRPGAAVEAKGCRPAHSMGNPLYRRDGTALGASGLRISVRCNLPVRLAGPAN